FAVDPFDFDRFAIDPSDVERFAPVDPPPDLPLERPFGMARPFDVGCDVDPPARFDAAAPERSRADPPAPRAEPVDPERSSATISRPAIKTPADQHAAPPMR